MDQCVTTVEATTSPEVLATTVAEPTAEPSGNVTGLEDEGVAANDTEARWKRELAKNETIVPPNPTQAPTMSPTHAPTPAATTEDPCAVPLEPTFFTCKGNSESTYQCDISSDLEQDGVYTVEVVMVYEGGHPLFKPTRKEIEVQFNGPYPRKRKCLSCGKITSV